ncbi:MAG: hypothetical protein AAGB22_14795 [Bacteroidota bacterium]
MGPHGLFHHVHELLFADYEEGFAIIELIGEWNDCLYNDIMIFKRNIIDALLDQGINKFVLIGENILNFHSSDDCYYEEWFEDAEEGWVALINFREHVLEDMRQVNIDHYFLMDGPMNDMVWATYRPLQFYQKVEQLVARRLGAPAL